MKHTNTGQPKRFPKPDTHTDRAFRMIHKKGSASIADIEQTGMLRKTFHSTASAYGVKCIDGQYVLPTWLANFYDGLHVEIEQPREVVPPRTVIKTSPLNGYAENLRRAASLRGGLREIGFHPTGQSFDPWRFTK